MTYHEALHDGLEKKVYGQIRQGHTRIKTKVVTVLPIALNMDICDRVFRYIFLSAARPYGEHCDFCDHHSTSHWVKELRQQIMPPTWADISQSDEVHVG